MTVSIMQPYLLPYIGYFQLMAASDVFVIADDAQYIAGGWVNRNRILVNGAADWITMPVFRADHRLLIQDRNYILDHPAAQRVRRRIVGAYRRAPYFDEAMVVIDEVLTCQDSNVARFNSNGLLLVAKRLGIDTPVRLSSTLTRPEGMAGQALVIDRCRQLGATRYLNPIGGLALYSPAPFESAGLTLRFLASDVVPYSQFGRPPLAALSIVDVLMFNDLASIRRMLLQYRLLQSQELLRAGPQEALLP